MKIKFDTLKYYKFDNIHALHTLNMLYTLYYNPYYTPSNTLYY